MRPVFTIAGHRYTWVTHSIIARRVRCSDARNYVRQYAEKVPLSLYGNMRYGRRFRSPHRFLCRGNRGGSDFTTTRCNRGGQYIGWYRHRSITANEPAYYPSDIQ